MAVRSRRLRYRRLDRYRHSKEFLQFLADQSTRLAAGADAKQFTQTFDGVNARFATDQDFTVSSVLGFEETFVLNPLKGAGKTFTVANATDLATAAAHGYADGDGPFFVSNAGGALPTGLAANTPYWLDVIDANTFKFATSKANALAHTVIDITADGSGTQTINGTGLKIDAADLTSGNGPVVVSSTGTLPTGLAAATNYWVTKLDAETVMLSTSAANQASGTYVNVTAAGSGVHTMSGVPAFVSTSHGLSAGDGPLLMSSSGVLPAPFSNASIQGGDEGSLDQFFNGYVWAKDIIDANTFTVSAVRGGARVDPTDDGTGTHNVSGVPSIQIDDHGLHDGDGPFTLTGSDLPNGLTASTEFYYTQAIGEHDLLLMLTRQDAIDHENAVTFSDVGSGAMTMVSQAEVGADDRTFTVNASTDVFTSAEHGYSEGEGPFLASNTGGALPAGMNNSTFYWVHRLDGDTFKLSKSKKGAVNKAQYLDVTDAGSGTNKLARATSVAAVFDTMRTGASAQDIRTKDIDEL